MRIDKYLANATELSRREVHIQLKRGQVTINGELVKKFSLQVPEAAEVSLAGNVIAAKQSRYIMLHKPEGYVCANSDADQAVVLDLLEKNADLQICGRLDIDTTGLVLLSDDGQWNHRVTSPKHGCMKRYHVHLSRDLSTDAESQLQQGIRLKNEIKICKPADIERLSDNEVIIGISEGRYHQVKRMFAAVGNHVLKLHRLSIGAIELDKDLSPGEHRPLSQAEIDNF